ncbi:hypothetical protein OHA98_06390 [Streptomyces sp. NBC_00654]|uniref:hypothetical protein n=1 Tax=Streptomyces sp. NBC_00654 TaxID=2975799 RepID=UPI00225888F1|nr:hypothetical protein [Streptomyces sp. NBC_00654]MCX4964452.1 hypothetical protein [Streptomyces sp. NBC_00654]
MSVTRRTLLTTTAAGTLLCALWFVPSANATVDRTAHRTGAAESAQPGAGPAAGNESSGETLADTGTGVDTTPYLIGGTALLGIGAGFVTYSARRGTVRPAL